MKFRYSQDIPLQLQVWLATDNYVQPTNPNAITATTLLKPVKSLVLSKRVEAQIHKAITEGTTSLLDPKDKPDLASKVKSCMGTAMHDSVELSWKNNYKQALTDLGYSQEFIDRVVINPESQEGLAEDAITIFTEKRLTRALGQFEISGELDFCLNSVINDLKTTSTYAYALSGDWNHRMQMSIYRWIFRGNGFEISSTAQINYIFNDWKAWEVGKPGYPATNPAKKEMELFSDDEVEKFITQRIQDIKDSKGKKESDLIPCTPEDLWQDQSKFAYYKDPTNTTGRASKVEAVYEDAVEYMNRKGGEGIIVERVGKVKRCNFCAGSSLCTQKDTYIQAGLLEYNP